ncbi:MAG: type I DNA topoisomerase [Ignavibacteriaceae bacterium]|jgi:DNA topoisomerase-1|nr:type I DNA topoisomerase [Ignavibacteriaceae bacterium]
MAKNLILVESPSKAKTINKYLGRNYTVEATVGHLRNLPKTKLGIDTENGFKPTLLNIRGKGDLIKRIKNLSTKATNIFIATDPDREGEAIAQDILDLIESSTDANIKRVLFNEITKKTVNEALNSPIDIDNKLVASQRARRAMDRIIGYKISPFLWKSILDSYEALSAGRVQSVALRLICEREEEILSFLPIEYWSLVGNFETEDKNEFTAKLFEVDGRAIRTSPKANMTDEEKAEFSKDFYLIDSAEIAAKLYEDVKGKDNFVISDISKKESKRNPFPPFITSTLQVEASRKLRYRPRKTMQLAQNLYEGIDLGSEGTTGLITYMRTDSTRLNEDIVSDARNFIKSKYGEKYLPGTAKKYDSSKKKNVQDAHEAIRPTSLKYTPEFVKEFLSDDQNKLYELIWKRFVASQMEPAQIETTTVSVKADEYLFKTSGSAIKFDGFLALYDESTEEKENGESNGAIGNIPYGLEPQQKLSLLDLIKNQHFTKPPPRFSESSLIKELESNGIGRPSTYASIISTINDRKYIDQIERKIHPTKLGKKVNEILVKNFSGLFNVSFTAKMEEELDQIAEGENTYEDVMNDFYNPFTSQLKEVEENMEKIICDKCGAEMEFKVGRFGRFLACSNYPECKNIRSLKEQSGKSEPEYTGELCPKCNSKTVYRDSKFGRFIGCEKYPDCDFTKVISSGIKCPKCSEGDVVIKRTKKRKIFYGCSRYPECEYASWTMPKADAEPELKNEVADDDDQYV